ncbi:unnamed protein product [Ectocarpus sp. 12 AP-2014]
MQPVYLGTCDRSVPRRKEQQGRAIPQTFGSIPRTAAGRRRGRPAMAHPPFPSIVRLFGSQLFACAHPLHTCTPQSIYLQLCLDVRYLVQLLLLKYRIKQARARLFIPPLYTYTVYHERYHVHPLPRTAGCWRPTQPRVPSHYI